MASMVGSAGGGGGALAGPRGAVETTRTGVITAR